MDANTLKIISIAAFVVAALFFAVAVILFFAFDIPAVWGELSGKTAAKQVAEIRAANRNVSSRRRELVRTNSANTAKTKTTGRLQSENTSRPIMPQAVNMETDLLVEETALLQEETALLEPKTTMLSEETTMLSPETTLLDGGTTLLSPETTLLDEGTTLLSENSQINNNFVMIQSVVIVHTNERI